MFFASLGLRPPRSEKNIRTLLAHNDHSGFGYRWEEVIRFTDSGVSIGSHGPLVSDEVALKASLASPRLHPRVAVFFPFQLKAVTLTLKSRRSNADTMLVLARPHPLQVSYDYNILLTCLGQPDLRFSFSLGRPSLWSFDFKPLFLRLIAWFHYSPASGINLKPRNYTRAHLTSTFALEVLKYRIIVEIYIRCWASTEFSLANYRVNDLIVAYLCPGESTAHRLQVANLNAENQIIDGRIAKAVIIAELGGYIWFNFLTLILAMLT
ncbi:hypothetical protein C8R44DRAFT_753139 [Mycena epipterygia]|nr:hypothetical protein C8R44DRAFT_753139 [Mycena epipterygia]